MTQVFFFEMAEEIFSGSIVPAILPRLITSIYSLNRIYQKENVPAERIAIVFGAGLKRDGTPAAFMDVYVNNPIPVLGDPEPLFVD